MQKGKGNPAQETGSSAAAGLYIHQAESSAAGMDVIGTGSALRGAVIAFYLSNEGLSLLENASYIGLPVPDRLKEVLSQLHKRDEKNGDEDGGE